MAERRPNLPEWTFKDGNLVTINKIRREKLGEDWVGDESNGLPKGQPLICNDVIVTIEERLKTF